jgi:hypothetical protein
MGWLGIDSLDRAIMQAHDTAVVAASEAGTRGCPVTQDTFEKASGELEAFYPLWCPLAYGGLVSANSMLHSWWSPFRPVGMVLMDPFIHQARLNMEVAEDVAKMEGCAQLAPVAVKAARFLNEVDVRTDHPVLDGEWRDGVTVGFKGASTSPISGRYTETDLPEDEPWPIVHSVRNGLLVFGSVITIGSCLRWIREKRANRAGLEADWEQSE